MRSWASTVWYMRRYEAVTAARLPAVSPLRRSIRSARRLPPSVTALPADPAGSQVAARSIPNLLLAWSEARSSAVSNAACITSTGTIADPPASHLATVRSATPRMVSRSAWRSALASCPVHRPTTVTVGASSWGRSTAAVEPGGAASPRRADAAAARASGGAMTAATLRAQQIRLAGRGRCGGDAQEWAATNPVAALPCARTPLPTPLAAPLLRPLLNPSTATVGVCSPAGALFEQVRGTDPGRSRANPARDRPGSGGKLQQRRATGSRRHAGAVVAGRLPTNGVGGLPAGSR